MINSRIKELRGFLDLTQEEFGNEISVTKMTIIRVEKDGNVVTDKVVNAIANQFNVNECWLRTGEGEMFNDTSAEDELAMMIAKLIKNSDDSNFEARFVKAVMKLSQADWDRIKQFVDDVSNEE